MSVADNFDYSIPTISKGNTMYLSTINKNDAIIRPFKKMVTQRNWSANLYNLDIENSMPRRFGIFTNKVDYINKLDDIERTNPKILHYPLNKPEYNLSNKDIEKSSPQLNHLKTNRCCNPLEPKYTLAKVENFPPSEPKFIRDSIDIKDISGAQPQKCFKWKTRETFPLDNHGIQGSKTKKTYVRQNLGNFKYNYIDYSDLTRDIFKSKRNTNPLDPVYNFKKKDCDMYQYGPIEKSKPKTNYPYFYQPALGMKVDDIYGTNIGSKNHINKFNGKNFEMTTNDIKGCNVGSLKKGIVTNRCTNPLNPNYELPGMKETDGMKNGEYSKKKTRAISQNFSNRNLNKNNKINNVVNNNNEESKNQQNIINNKNNFNNQSEPIMMKINDMPDNNINYNYEEQKNEIIPFQEEFSGGNFNPNVNFDKEKYGKKPNPFFGFSHDPYVQSSENPERLKEIEKNKKILLSMAKTTTNNFYNNDKLVDKYKNNPNASNFQKSNKLYYNNANANCLGGVGQLNLENNINNNNEIKKMNKTSSGFRPLKKTYEEKLDMFMERNNLKYIEPPKVEKNPPQPVVVPEPEVVQSTASNKGKKTSQKSVITSKPKSGKK